MLKILNSGNRILNIGKQLQQIAYKGILNQSETGKSWERVDLVRELKSRTRIQYSET